ncbi:hypothetical protein LXL04_017778 [Taraxacum kok-saghyz]
MVSSDGAGDRRQVRQEEENGRKNETGAPICEEGRTTAQTHHKTIILTVINSDHLNGRTHSTSPQLTRPFKDVCLIIESQSLALSPLNQTQLRVNKHHFIESPITMTSLAIGIDLGTTSSCVAVWHHDRVQIIANDQGNRTTPSTVAFTDSGRLIGDDAKNQVAMNPRNTVYG